MSDRSQVLARNLASVTGERKKRRSRTLKTDRILQLLVADLVAARLESGVCTRPTLSTIEKYADAVGALIEIRTQ